MEGTSAFRCDGNNERIMRTLGITLALASIFSLIPAQAASDREIDNLSDGALLGEIQSTQALQQAFDANADQLALAGSEIGLSPQQYHEVRMAIAEGRARYVELPRHIDAMSGQHGGRVFIVRDIRIPKGVYGWEVDLDEAHDVVKVYVPNRCGNLSLVRVRPRVLAAAPVYHRVNVAYAAPIAGPFAPLPASYEAASPAPVVAYQPELSAPHVAQVATHHFAMLPFLAGALVAGFLASGGHGSGVSVNTHPTPVPVTPPVVVVPPGAPSPAPPGPPAPVARPTPTPVSCPTIVRRRRP